jgi:hypothetical protein
MWDSLTNEIINDELVVSATCTSDIGFCDDLISTPVGADELAIGLGIEPGEEQTYTLTFEFIETSSAQNYNQGKTFNGVLRVEDSLQTFALTGMLLDSNGNPVENAVIEVHSKVRTGITDENGIFGISGVEVGNHEMVIKNLSNEVMATDSITLEGGQSETITNKDIIADTNNAAINMTVKLGEASNIDTISVLNYESICAINPNALGCKLYENGIKIITNLNGGTLDTIFKARYNKNETVVVGEPFKEGYAFSGWSITGKGATINDGALKLGTSSVSLTANYVELNSMYSYTGNSTLIDDGNGNWRIKFLTSGTFTPHFDMEIDSFLVGGGGGGGSGAGGGGGGGYTSTQYKISLENNTAYGIIIGQGGAGGTDNGSGYNGGSTSAFGYTTLGGSYGNGWSSSPSCAGGNGGSGGGGGTETGTGGSGGNDGINGNAGSRGPFGTGQGTTTREFGLLSEKLYASGGGGANNGTGSNGAGNGGSSNNVGENALPNTGGGGGGSGSTGSSATYAGGNGGSGIVVIRNRRLPDVGLTNKYYFSYTGVYALENEDTDNWTIKFLTSGIFTPIVNMNIDVLLVGGGGGGGDGVHYSNNGAGGGGGGVIYESSHTITSGSYSIVVGNGGIRNTNGQNTTFNGLVAIGGGAGESASTAAGNGGSGGGAIPNSIAKGTGTTGQGYAGGNGATSSPWAGGGGGGASELGNTDGAGLGGDGITYSIAGSSITLGGGGSGGNDATRLAGGDGGGGTGAVYSDSYGGGNGTANTGGGGGGGASRTSSVPGGTGGTGIVIISAGS